MDISNKAVEKFQVMYAKEYGINLSDREAREYGTRLILLVKAAYGKNLPKRFDKHLRIEK